MSATRTRSRELVFPYRKGDETWIYDVPVVADGSDCERIKTRGGSCSARRYSSQATRYMIGKQVTASEGHNVSRLNAAGGDVGGPFSTSKTTFENTPQQGRWTTAVEFFGGGTPASRSFNRFYEYRGSVMACNPVNILFPPSSKSTTNELNMLGTKAISLVKPGEPVADLATFLGELHKDGLPSVPDFTLWKEMTGAARKSGDQYLNAQFGYAPVARDIASFAAGIVHAREAIRQYERDANRVVRRRYYFPPSTTSTTSVAATGVNTFPVLGNELMSGTKGDIILTRTVDKRQWFSGAFTYYLPTGYDSRKTMDEFASRAQVILNTDITPEVLWNLAPWSWAVDWFANVGDVLSNVMDFTTGSLVMRYGYLMEHTITTDTYSRREPVANTLYGFSVNGGSFRFITETKTRIKANPFGFGVSWNSLSPFQLSIAAALGLSRS